VIQLFSFKILEQNIHKKENRRGFYFKKLPLYKESLVPFFFNVIYFSPNSISSQLDMTCCVSTVSCKVEDVILIIPHTNITVTFGRFIFVNILYIICLEKGSKFVYSP
jgi:hypothetical protein